MGQGPGFPVLAIPVMRRGACAFRRAALAAATSLGGLALAAGPAPGAALEAPFSGQDPGTDPGLQDLLRDWTAINRTFVLLYRAEEARALGALSDVALTKLRIEAQLTRLELPADLAASLWEARGWGREAHWLLASPDGEVLGDGPGLPSGDAVMALLREKGIPTRWEERRAFLAEHPGNGEAWVEEVQKCFRLAITQVSSLAAQGRAVRGGASTLAGEAPAYALADPDPEARARLADQVFQEFADALEGLSGVDRWWDHPIGVFGLLPHYGAGASPRLRRLAEALARSLEERMERSGPESFLEDRWIAFRSLAGLSIRELPDLAPLPGEPGLPPALLAGCVTECAGRKDWDGALAFLDGLPARDAREPWTPEGWKAYCAFQATVSGLRVRPLWELGRVQEARAAMEALRAWSGPSWGEDGRGVPLLATGLLEAGFYREIAGKPALPAPSMPPQGPAPRLALLGDPAWRQAWDALWKADPLLPWGGGELPLAALAPEEAAALRSRAGWGQEPRWALLRGNEVLASGAQCPTPDSMAGILAREAPSRLRVLGAFLERHPENLAARRARMALLAARMPEPRLEPLLAEDARIAFDAPGTVPAASAPWKPNPALWQWSAQQALPRIEALLRSWPSDPGLWRAWLAWARFHPLKPSVTVLARDLAVWGGRSRWLGALSPEAHQAVAAELRKGGDYEEIVRWLGDAWEGMDRRPGDQLTDGEWEALRAYRQKLRPAVVAPLAEAYRMLERPEDALALEAAYHLMMVR